MIQNTSIYFPLTNPEKVETWGMNQFSLSQVFKPKSEKEIRELYHYANSNKLKICFRGGGCSYGDASINNHGIVVDMREYNKILSFDESSGVIHVESGVSIKQIWEFSIEKGFWPPVVSGTMFPTIGGALGMNIHGKNNFQVGPLGEHILEFNFLTPSGEKIFCDKERNKDLFYSLISSFGSIGCFLDVKIKLKKIYSGKMKVTPEPVKSIEEMVSYFEKHRNSSDYLVGWVDAFGAGEQIGRGLIHKADHLQKGEDKNFPENSKLKNQVLPNRFFGLIPKSWMWLFLFPFSNNLGMRFVNFVKYKLGFLSRKPYLQGHAEYAFLLDYVPNWKFIYKPGSMIQYQIFIPEEKTIPVMKEILTVCQKKGIVSYLAVFKRHKKDEFLFSHSVNGYSMAMDFPVTKSNKEKLWNLCYEMDEIVLKNNGKFYLAKDSVLRKNMAEKIFGTKAIETLKNLKKTYDPNSILESDMFRRIIK
jgi:decaprenylphospho-beta-D-ribofuranose 2-oxidase